MTQKKDSNCKRSKLLTSSTLLALSMIFPLNISAYEENTSTENEINEIDKAYINQQNSEKINTQDVLDNQNESIDNKEDITDDLHEINSPDTLQSDSQSSSNENIQTENDIKNKNLGKTIDDNEKKSNDDIKEVEKASKNPTNIDEKETTNENQSEIATFNSHIESAKTFDNNLSLPISESESSEIIRNLKTNLLVLGYGDSNSKDWTQPDMFFGNQTKQALEKFQSDYSLPVTGEFDQLTAEKIEGVLNLNTGYSVGDSHEDIRNLKSNLLLLGYGDPNSKHWVNPDDYFGPGTKQALEKFQSDYSLLVTGEFDQLTAEKIEGVLNLNTNTGYSVGDSHEDIRNLKSNLLLLGYGDPNSKHWVNPDDYFGPGTKQALEKFQLNYYLPVTGEFDQLTAETIEQALNLGINTSYSSGDSHEDIRNLKMDLLLLGYGDPNSKHWTNPDTFFGTGTKQALITFQRDFELPTHGRFDILTSQKIDTIVSTSYYEGQRHEKIRNLKSDLLLMGYGNPTSKHWTTPDTYFGTGTKQALIAFQGDFNLPTHGVLDELTAEKIENVVTTSYFMGQSNQVIQLLKKDLLLMGYGDPNSEHWVNPDAYFGLGTKQALLSFQKDNNLRMTGILDTLTAEKINYVKTHKLVEYNITLDQALEMQMKVNPQTDQPYAYVSVDWVGIDGIVTANVLNVRTGPAEHNSILNTLKQGDKVEILERVGNWYRISYKSSAWVSAAREDVAYYLNPENFINSPLQMFQFLDLSKQSDVSTTQLNKFLKDKGILDGMGQAFITASNVNGVNEIYLLSHALLETGHGTSELATGVEVNGVTVYNMFGIGAIDSDPIGGGSRRAYDEGWTTPEKAIIGGARFIGNNYIKAGQNTLYSMRWNPNAMHTLGYTTHQYATDIGWASKQVSTIYNLYEDVGINNPFFVIPVYK